MPLFVFALAGLLSLAGVPSSQAVSLARYWDDLEAARSIAALSALPAPAVTGAHAEVAEGMLRLRRYELGRDRTDAFVGRRVLERAVERAPADAWAHFAHGALLVRGPDARLVIGDEPALYVIDPHSLAAQHAPRALRRALELQPTLHVAAYLFAEYALDMGTLPLLEEAQQSLTRDGRAQLPRALLLRAQVHARIGDLGGAIALADSARLHGGDAALAAHARAAAQLRRPGAEADGAAAYFAGVDALTPAAAGTYFTALRILVTDAEASAWEAADLAEKRVWLRRFWDMHAALAGVTVTERLTVHYRRVADVYAHGRGARMGGPAAAPGGMGDARAFGVASHGALLMIRHGDPLRALRVLYCGNEVLDLPQPLQPTPQQCLATPMGRFRAHRMSATRLYQIHASDRAEAGSTYYPPFETHLALVHELLQFRGIGGRTDVVAATAVPIESARMLMDTPARLDARITIALIDTAAMHVQRRELPLTFAAAQLPESGWVLLSSSLSAEPRQDVRYRVTLTNGAATAGRIVGGRIDVRSYAHDSLDLSDVVVAPRDGAGSWQRGNQRISLAPGRELRRDESFTLYYEIYGVTAEAAYRTELAIEPVPSGVRERIRSLFPGARETLRLTFHDVATRVDPVFGVQESRVVDVGGFAPGEYRLRVTITLADGSAAVREQRLFIVED